MTESPGRLHCERAAARHLYHTHIPNQHSIVDELASSKQVAAPISVPVRDLLCMHAFVMHSMHMASSHSDREMKHCGPKRPTLRPVAQKANQPDIHSTGFCLVRGLHHAPASGGVCARLPRHGCVDKGWYRKPGKHASDGRVERLKFALWRCTHIQLSAGRAGFEEEALRDPFDLTGGLRQPATVRLHVLITTICAESRAGRHSSHYDRMSVPTYRRRRLPQRKNLEAAGRSSIRY